MNKKFLYIWSCLYLLLIVIGFLYIGNKADSQVKNLTTSEYQRILDGTANFIILNIKSDLLSQNIVGAQYKLSQLYESKLISGYKVIQNGVVEITNGSSSNSIKFEKKIYFNESKQSWGEVVLNFSRSHLNDLTSTYSQWLGNNIFLISILTVLLLFLFLSLLIFSSNEMSRALNVYFREFRILKTSNISKYIWTDMLNVLKVSLVDREDSLKKSKEIEKMRIKNEVASQVAHDIKSPLAALEIVMEDIKELPEDSRELTLNAINRIQEIANNLSKDAMESGEENEVKESLVSYILMMTINEKKLELQSKSKLNIELIDLTEHMNFININSVEFSRVISNLVNNSAQAIKHEGCITVKLNLEHNNLKLRVSDDGVGFPPSVLNSPIKLGNTVGKVGGQGLGLFHACKTVLDAKGHFEIYNDNGAVVDMEIPVRSPPSWFQDKIEFNCYERVFIIDDDRSIHDLWRRVFKSKDLNMEVINVQVREEIESRLNEVSVFDLVLMDNDLRFSKTGLELIKDYGFKNIVLVTSGYEQHKVQSFCTENNIKILPKYLIGYL